jgi:hypothetical protein
MDRNDLRRCLDREVDRWSTKPYEALKTELRDVVAYSVGEESEFYQVEVQLVESLHEYLHVLIAVEDGGWRAFVPVSTSFLSYRDGRVVKPDA